MKTLIKHVTILTMDDADRVLRDGWLLIDGEKIAALGEAEPQSEEGGAAASGCSSAGGSSATAQAENSLDSAAASARTTAASQPIENQQQATAARPIENLLQAEVAADEVIDGRGGILLPGFVNTHCHVSMVPFRSMGDDCPDRLRRFLFPLELEAMTPELVYWGALYGIAEMFLSGTTTFLDMYYFEDRVAEACEQAGIRGYLGETLIGQKTCDSPDAEYGGFAYQKDFFAEYHGARHPRIHPIIAPHGTTTLPPEKLREAHDLAVQYDTIFTLHASEMDYEMEHFRAMGMTPTAFLDSIGALDAHTLAAHCIHMTEEDLQLLKARGAGIAHCICSNTKAGKGVAPMERARQLGIGFGPDHRPRSDPWWCRSAAWHSLRLPRPGDGRRPHARVDCRCPHVPGVQPVLSIGLRRERGRCRHGVRKRPDGRPPRRAHDARPRGDPRAPRGRDEAVHGGRGEVP